MEEKHPQLSLWLSEMKDKDCLPERIRGKVMTMLNDKYQTKCRIEGCNKFAPCMHEACRIHRVVIPSCQTNKFPSFAKLNKWEDLRSKVVYAIQSGRPVPKPKAADEIDFEIDNPPEGVRQPSKPVTYDCETRLAENDVLLPSKFDRIILSSQGNVSFRELLCDTQAFYMMSHTLKRRLVAKSLVFIVQKVGFVYTLACLS